MIDVHIIVVVMLIIILVEVRFICRKDEFMGFYLGRGRGGRGHLTSTNIRLPPSTHFVRPQPEISSQSRSKLYSLPSTSNHHHHCDANSLKLDFEHNYATTLPRYYGTRNGQITNSTDYGDFRISMF